MIVLGFCWWEPRRVFIDVVFTSYAEIGEYRRENRRARAASVKISTRITDKIDTHRELSVSYLNYEFIWTLSCVCYYYDYYRRRHYSWRLLLHTCSAISCNVNNTMALPFRIYKTMNYCVVVTADHGHFAYVSVSRRNVSVEIWCDFMRLKLNDSEPSDAFD